MAISAITGPSVVFGLTQTSTGGVQEYNEERGASLFDCGVSIADPRAPNSYRPGGAVGTPVYGWWKGDAVVDCAPGTVNSCAVALLSSANTVAGTAITLSTVNNSVVTIGVTMYPSDGSSARTVIALDSTYATAPRGLAWGVGGGTVVSWDPTTALQRQITLTRGASQDDTGATYTIQGFDQYGRKVTETITGTSSTGGSVYTSRKTFKYIQSITPAGTLGATTIAAGVNDTYGFPLPVHQPCYVDIWSGPSSAMNRMTAQSSLITLAATVTQTATTQDIRGTWASTIASNSTQAAPQRIFMRVEPAAQDVWLQSQTYSATGHQWWVGYPQYSS